MTQNLHRLTRCCISFIKLVLLEAYMYHLIDTASMHTWWLKQDLASSEDLLSGTSIPNQGSGQERQA